MEFPKRFDTTCLQVINKLRNFSVSLSRSLCHFPASLAIEGNMHKHACIQTIYHIVCATCGTSSMRVPSLRDINWHFNHLCTSFRTPTAKKRKLHWKIRIRGRGGKTIWEMHFAWRNVKCENVLNDSRMKCEKFLPQIKMNNFLLMQHRDGKLDVSWVRRVCRCLLWGGG